MKLSSCAQFAIIVTVLSVIGIVLLIVLFADLNDNTWTVFGQQQTTTQPTTTTTSTTPTIAPNPNPGGTPVVATQEEIATTDDLASQFNTLLATSGTGVVGGIGALWAIIRKKTSKIDNALRGNDFDQRDLLELINNVFEAADKNPTMPLGDILKQPAYKDKTLLKKSIAQAWSEEYDEYMEWFESRYMVNKK